MNDKYIVTTYGVIDDILKAYGVEDDCRAREQCGGDIDGGRAGSQVFPESSRAGAL